MMQLRCCTCMYATMMLQFNVEVVNVHVNVCKCDFADCVLQVWFRTFNFANLILQMYTILQRRCCTCNVAKWCCTFNFVNVMCTVKFATLIVYFLFLIWFVKPVFCFFLRFLFFCPWGVFPTPPVTYIVQDWKIVLQGKIVSGGAWPKNVKNIFRVDVAPHAWRPSSSENKLI